MLRLVEALLHHREQGLDVVGAARDSDLAALCERQERERVRVAVLVVVGERAALHVQHPREAAVLAVHVSSHEEVDPVRRQLLVARAPEQLEGQAEVHHIAASAHHVLCTRVENGAVVQQLVVEAALLVVAAGGVEVQDLVNLIAEEGLAAVLAPLEGGRLLLHTRRLVCNEGNGVNISCESWFEPLAQCRSARARDDVGPVCVSRGLNNAAP